jgi:hypothetical protein
VCDAGGGTVDLITYQVAEIQPSLELAELVPGSGGMAGSLLLNKRFEEAVHNLVGDEQWITLKNKVGWFKALNDFDKNIKTSFKVGDNDSHYVSFPRANLEDDFVEGLIDDCWEMSA